MTKLSVIIGFTRQNPLHLFFQKTFIKMDLFDARYNSLAKFHHTEIEVGLQ